METIRIPNGNTERILVTALNSSGSYITGLTNMLLEIRQKSDGYYYDFNDIIFKNSGWTTRQKVMTELNSTYSPGEYYYDFNTTGLTDNDYALRITCATAANSPWGGELKVGGFIDLLSKEATISAGFTAGAKEANIETHVLNKLNTYDAPTYTELTSYVTQLQRDIMKIAMGDVIIRYVPASVVNVVRKVAIGRLDYMIFETIFEEGINPDPYTVTIIETRQLWAWYETLGDINPIKVGEHENNTVIGRTIP